MRPTREIFRQADQTYFVTFQTARRQCLFRHQSWSNLFLQTLEKYLPQIGLHDFVIMPDHIHLLLSPQVPLEKAVQLIKGGFSFRAKRELQWNGDIWQVGFTDHRIRDIEDLGIHLQYLMKNKQSGRSEGKAIRATDTPLVLHPFPQWLKPQSSAALNGGAEAPPLQSSSAFGDVGVPPLQTHPPLLEGRTDIRTARDAAELFRKLGI
jgi:putative transposase